MAYVMGLFEQRATAEQVADMAQQADVAADKIKILDLSSPAGELVEPNAREMTMRAIRSFGLLGLLVFVLFGLLSAIYTMAVAGAPATVAIAIFIIFALVGFLCGVFMGWVKGRADADNEIQHYRELMWHGKTLVVVQTDRQANKVAAMMKQQNGQPVYVTKQAVPAKMPGSTQELAVAVAH